MQLVSSVYDPALEPQLLRSVFLNILWFTES
jgi:hypothetical protein